MKYWLKKRMVFYLYAALAFVSVVFLFACSSYVPLQPGTFYKRDMAFEEGGNYYQGISVLPKKDRYHFVIEPKDDEPDLLIIRTCHREHDYERDRKSIFEQIKAKIFKGKDGLFTYDYDPVPDLETDRVCPLRGDAYHSGKENSQHSWFYVDFEKPDIYKLGFDITCNSVKIRADGVGACQARKGTVQVVEFDSEVMFADPEPAFCAKPIPVSKTRFEIDSTLGECLYMAKDRLDNFGYFVLIGYEGILLRRPL